MHGSAPTAVRLADGNVDLHRELVHRGGAVTALTTREAALLGYLAARAGESVSREDLLSEVWGYAPTVITRAIDTTMRRLRTKIESDPAQPVHLLTVHGVGYRFEPPVAGPGLTTAPPTDLDRGLGADPDPFVGRATERQHLEDALERWPVVTLLGAPGVGKSRLALHLARRRHEQGGVVFVVGLQGRTTPEDVAEAIAARLGRPLPAGPAVESAAHLLAAHRGLWVLDDADEAVPAVAEALSVWLERAGECRFLITCRERLRIDGEGCVELDPLAERDARTLFCVRARALDDQLDLGDADLASVVERLDGNPLAVELAAARVRTLGLTDLAARLQAPLRLLDGGMRGRSPRRASLRGALEVSFELLSSVERAVLGQLAVFRGGFTVDLVEAVVVLPDDSDDGPMDVLLTLRDRSLVQRVSRAGERRFRLSTPIRERASERMGSDLRRALALRHLGAMLEVGERLVAACATAPACLDRLAAERANLLAAWAAARTPGDTARLAVVLDALLEARGPLAERLSLLDEAVARCVDAPRALALEVLRRRGEARRIAGRTRSAAADLREALQGAADLGDAALQARTLAGLGALAWMCGEAEEAAAWASRAVGTAAAVGEVQSEVRATITRAGAARLAGDPVAAEAWLLEALGRCRGQGAADLEGVVLHNLASLTRERGDLDAAAELLARACDAHGLVGNARREAVARHNLASLEAVRGDLAAAQRHVREALELARSGGELAVTSHIRHTLGHLLHRQGSLGEAELAYIDAVEGLREVDPLSAASALGDLAALQADRGQIPAAERGLRDVEQRCASASDPGLDLVLELHRGHVDVAHARAAPDPQAAAPWLARARGRLARVRAADAAARDRCRLSVQLLEQILERCT